jgi:hypothetical protein
MERWESFQVSETRTTGTLLSFVHTLLSSVVTLPTLPSLFNPSTLEIMSRLARFALAGLGYVKDSLMS